MENNSNSSDMQTVNAGFNSKTGGISFSLLAIIYCIFTVAASVVTAIDRKSVV